MADTNAPAAETNPGEQGALPDVQIELDIGGDPASDTPPEVPSDLPPGEPVQYQPTGDVGLDMALGFIGKLGIAPNDPTIQAARSGDFSLIKAKLAGYGDKAAGWEQFVALAENAFGQAQARAKDTAGKTRSIVEEAVGGAENWQAIQQWAKANADEDERAQINGMLNAGGMQARAAARLLSDLYNQAVDVIKEPADPAKATAARTPSAGNGPLSPQEYKLALRELTSKIGASRVNDSPEYQQLQQRRRAFRG